MANAPKELHPVTFFEKDETPVEGVQDWRPKLRKVEPEEEQEEARSPKDDAGDLAGTAERGE